MFRYLLVLLTATLLSTMNAQTVTVRYLKKQDSNREVSKEKARFMKTTTENLDGTVTTELKELGSDRLINRKTYKGSEPFGIWTYDSGKGMRELNYEFSLFLSDDSCKNVIPLEGITDYFVNNVDLKYIAPKIATGESDIDRKSVV